MPKKGFPRCECGKLKYRLVVHAGTYSVIVCRECGKKRRTSSVKRWQLERDTENRPA